MNEKGKTMKTKTKHVYRAVTHDNVHDCGHNHRTCEAALKCLNGQPNALKWLHGVIERDEQRANGIGLWNDGEPSFM